MQGLSVRKKNYVYKSVTSRSILTSRLCSSNTSTALYNCINFNLFLQTSVKAYFSSLTRDCRGTKKPQNLTFAYLLKIILTLKNNLSNVTSVIFFFRIHTLCWLENEFIYFTYSFNYLFNFPQR